MKSVFMYRRIRAILVASVFGLALTSLLTPELKGDTIELKTGERIEGVFKQASAAGAVIDVAGQPLTIPVEKLKAIYFGVASGKPASQPAQSAVDALRSLRSVTNSGIRLGDYLQRVLDSRITVDRYLSSASEDAAALRDAVRVAMLEYELASQTWTAGLNPVGNAGLWTPMGKTMQDSQVAKCSIVKSVVEENDKAALTSRSRKPAANAEVTDRSHDLGLALAIRAQYNKNVAPGLWSCAAEQLGAAERLLDQH
jgi:hypothetical protein